MAFAATSDRERVHRRATAAAMRRMAAATACPQCKRKSAVKRHDQGDMVMRFCRWCSWVDGYYLSDRVSFL
jgi:ribosomal protein L37AE/L43A